MLGQYRQLLVFAILAGVSYAVYEYAFAQEKQMTFKPFTKGYALYDSVVQITDDDGQIHSTIKSPEMIHYADSQLTTIESPQVVMVQNESQWTMRSSVATINESQTAIHFPDVVTVTNDASPPLALETSDMTVYPEQKTTQSPAAIVIHQAGRKISGVGSKIDFNNELIEVLDETHAEFDAQ